MRVVLAQEKNERFSMLNRTPLAASVGVVVLAVPALGTIDGANSTQTPLAGTLATLSVPDGTWDRALDTPLSGAAFGEDFGFVGSANPSVMWMREQWVGGIGSSAGFASSIAVTGLDPVFPINIMKEVTNDAGFFADVFTIELTETGGSTISGVFANPNAAFADVTITNPGPGVTLITYEVGAGTGLADGGVAVFDFGFETTGSISFEIVQTLIPAPGAAVLAIGAAVMGLRRRR